MQIVDGTGKNSRKLQCTKNFWTDLACKQGDAELQMFNRNVEMQRVAVLVVLVHGPLKGQ